MLSLDPEWYYVDPADPSPDHVRGPVSERDIDALYQAADLTEFSLLWREGQDRWRPLKELAIYSAISIKSDPKEAMPNTTRDESPSLHQPKAVVQAPETESGDIPGDVLLRAKDILSQKNKEPIPADKLRKITKKKKRKEKQKAKWYTPKINTNVYVQGLPKDMTRQEIIDFFTKAGVLRLDPETGEERIKLYTDKTTEELKGDATISYFNEESVHMALDFLNGKEIRPGFPLQIERAVFKPKGDEYIPRTKKQIDELAKIKFKANKEKLFSWNEEEATEGLRIVVLKNMFGVDDFTEETREEFFKLLEADIRQEVERIGEVKRLEVFKFNPEGVVKIKFAKSDSATRCIEMLNDRYYNGRMVQCFYYDGVTNYRVNNESLEQEQERIDDFGKWLATQLEHEALENIK